MAIHTSGHSTAASKARHHRPPVSARQRWAFGWHEPEASFSYWSAVDAIAVDKRNNRLLANYTFSGIAQLL
ncbi:hypothetical protein [Microcoleus sp. FACHB-672]|uniref:hypothetical protein n=1 Tax=Microcoleus sp. FACHB-672 TaxID=2692825 RepID=UPI001681E3B8|nr:hypothetical protein [Microcoleus sp. FACHB-672]MBD2039150.1 hypothetical protein [Microcoleus sp. FACHB-672]